MCDFHSIAVRADGAIAHVNSNSHSEAVSKAGWMENEPHKRKRFVECEWDGKGAYPGAEKITRFDKDDGLTVKQKSVIDRHYSNLAKALAGDIKALEYFEALDHRDVLDRFFAKNSDKPDLITGFLCDKDKISALVVRLEKEGGGNSASGNSSTAASSGNSSKAASSGYSSKAASSGDYSTAASSGDCSTAASSGDYSKAEAMGEHTIAMVAGTNGRVKTGEKGCFALVYWNDKQKRNRVVTGHVGEDGIKADTWYQVDSDGRLVEAK